MTLDNRLSVLLNTLMESVVGAATYKEWHKMEPIGGLISKLYKAYQC
jgi:hypothetical protein